MGSRCHVCEDARRGEIELALARKVSLKQISRKFGPSIFSIYRHSKNHMPATLQAALVSTGTPTVIDLEALRQSESEGLLQTLVVQRARIYKALDAAEESGDLRAVAALHGRLDGNVNTVAKLIGDINTHAAHVTNNVYVSPEFLTFRGELVKALRPIPEARKALARVLRSVEGAEPHFTALKASDE